ncbi:MAG: hypothetical protein HUU46_07740 [Candidatus Hydrogenedentes bacterium]|nr:hypothetical protein [Candidatus Hydrogenedentota bacterium]
MNRSRSRGALLVFEGPDGVGKSTLAAWAAEHLRARGEQCDLLSFPGREAGTLGKHVYELHYTPSSFGIAQINPVSLQTLHIAAHIDAIETRIRPALSQGRVVILDRFWWSTWVYGRANGVSAEALELMISLEKLYLEKLKPNATFLIQRSSPLRDEKSSFWEGLVREYQSLAAQEASEYPVHMVRNDDTIEHPQLQLTGILTDHGFCQRHRQRTRSNDAPVPDGKILRVPHVYLPLAPAKPTPVYDTYWKFACERQAIFFRRLRGASRPWTDDTILQQHKFTNAYRASDRVSQYLIRHVIYEGDPAPDDVVFRILLFKIFNKIETWELLTKNLGTVSLETYAYDRLEELLTAAMSRGQRIYSAAYIMPSGTSTNRESKKHRMHLRLIEKMIADELPTQLRDAPSMGKAFDLLRSYPSIGDFLAYQFVTDVNYSTVTNFSEMEFVVAGPGARDGIRKCFSSLGGLTENEIIRAVADRQQQEFERLGLGFQSLWGRPLQLIDCQNLFCEVDKYARVKHPDIHGISGRTRIKQVYRENTEPLQFWYPPKWELNEKVQRGGHDVHDI